MEVGGGYSIGGIGMGYNGGGGGGGGGGAPPPAPPPGGVGVGVGVSPVYYQQPHHLPPIYYEYHHQNKNPPHMVSFVSSSSCQSQSSTLQSPQAHMVMIQGGVGVGVGAGGGCLVDPELQKIHTLFIAGLPDDVKPREIHNLFRRRPGFDSCQLKYTGKGNQVVAFATFFNHQSAVEAMNALNGVTFDPETGAILHVELARSNSRTKRPWVTGAYAVIDKRVKVGNDTQETDSVNGDGGYDDPSSTDNPISSNKDALAATQSDQTTADMDNSYDKSNEQLEKSLAVEIPPCSTLFIANLGPSCTEEELKQALSQYDGFVLVKLRARGGMPVAFADFKEIENATEAMKNLQGTSLPSSDRGGMHVEYARAKMRKR